MLIRLEKKSDITRAAKRLREIGKSDLPETAYKYIGYPSGGRPDCLIRHNSQYWFWQEKFQPDGKPGRYLNWFGIYEEDRNSINIALEVNAYLEGKDRRVAGFFAKNVETERVYLMHSGGIGGGREGQNKFAFLDWRGGSLEEVRSSDGHKEKAIAVMALEGQRPLETAFAYVDEVHQYKQALRDGSYVPSARKTEIDKLKAFFSEGSGRRTGRRKSTVIDYISRHGLVVDGLKDWREASPIPHKCNFTKNVLIDLALSKGSEILELYEVKTGSGRQDIYTAIGQLMVHDAKGSSQKFIVIPDDGRLPADLRKTLLRLEIKVLRYEFGKSGPVFRQA